MDSEELHDGSVESAAAAIAALSQPPADDDPAKDAPEDEIPSEGQGQPDDREPDAAEEEPDVDDGDEAEADEPDDAEGDVEEDEEPEPTKTYTVKVGGEEVEVKEDELVAGYQRETDYRNKTAELAEQRRTFEQEREQQMQLWQSRLDAQVQMVMAGVPTLDSAELARMAEQEPEKWVAHQQVVADAHSKLQQLDQTRQEIEQQRQKEQGERDKEFIAKQIELMPQLVPDWAGEEGSKLKDAEQPKIVEYAIAKGFPKGELDNVFDARVWSVLRDGWQGSQKAEKVAIAKKKVKAAPAKTVRPGPGKGSKADRQASQLNELRSRAKKTGSVDDAAALFAAMSQKG